MTLLTDPPVPDGTRTRPDRVEKVTAQLDALDETFRQIAAWQPTDDRHRALRAHCFAHVYARKAGWWGVLFKATDWHTPFVYKRAVYQAVLRSRDQADFWRQRASEWSARASGNDPIPF